MSDLDANGLRAMILAYANGISERKLEIERLEYGKRNLEMQLSKLEAPPVQILDYKGPKTTVPLATCRNCGKKTRDRIETATHFKVAECNDCTMEAYAIQLATNRARRLATSNLSAPEQVQTAEVAS